MPVELARTVSVVLLAAVFTIGLTFATVEGPARVDGLLQRVVTTPGGDSHADDVSRLKTELFIGHFHLRAIGYACFALTLALIVAGFATRRTGLAVLGAVACMLPVFAQFAAVMFFLAGLGLLNVLWLPLLDISFALQRTGMIVRAPFDLATWVAAQFGLRAYWPLVMSCVGGGLLLFFLGVHAWLAARARGVSVASGMVYRLSRHPQYLGWIVWSYGVYLLLLRGHYPRRSWGIDASLPWLLSTAVILGVAMLEELDMKRRHGQAYEAYRRSAPFLLPLPDVAARTLLLPTRLLFGHEQPERRREVVAILVLWTSLLIVASGLAYNRGWYATADFFSSPAIRRERAEAQAARIREETSWRAVYRDTERLAAAGETAVEALVGLLGDDWEEVRAAAAVQLERHPSPRAVPALKVAVDDADANVRRKVVRALAAIGGNDVMAPIRDRLTDPDDAVRREAVRALAELGDDSVLSLAVAGLKDAAFWTRAANADALGALGSADALPALVSALDDESAEVRRAAVVALLRIGSVAVLPALEEASDDPDWEVRLYATETRKRLETLRR